MNFKEGIKFIRSNYEEYFNSACSSYLTWNDDSIFDKENSILCYVEIKEENLELILLTDLYNFKNVVYGYQIAIRKDKKNWKLNNICKFKKDNFEKEDLILPEGINFKNLDLNSEDIPNYYGINIISLENTKYFTNLSYLSNEEEIKFEVPEYNKVEYDRVRALSKKNDERTEQEEFEYIGLLNNFKILNIKR